MIKCPECHEPLTSSEIARYLYTSEDFYCDSCHWWFNFQFSHDSHIIHMGKIQATIQNLLFVYYLLNVTSKVNEDGQREPVLGFVDFDDVNSFYNHPFTVYQFDMTNKGQELGLLSRYEDELYSVDADVWYQLERTLENILWKPEKFFNSHTILR